MSELSLLYMDKPTSSGKILVHFSDESIKAVYPPFSYELLEDNGITDVEYIVKLAECSRCYRKGLDYLTRREHSKMQIHQKLLKKRFSNSAISKVLAILVEEGSLSDRRFSVQWIESRLRTHPEGRYNLEGGLRKRGVSGRMARETIQEVIDENPEALSQACLNYCLSLLRKGTELADIIVMAKKRAFSNIDIEDCSPEFYIISGMELLK